MKGTLYGVGVGPGDPKLLTVLAVETIQKCQVLAIPDSGKKDNVALTIVKDYIEEEKEILRCYMPMTYDKSQLEKNHKEAAGAIAAALDKGNDVCFVTLGDPTIYSTYIYLHAIIGQMGYETKLVPGVTSFCAVGAALNMGLCIGNEPLHIIPGANEGLPGYLDMPGTKVIMKSGQGIADICGILSEKGLEENSFLVEKCTMAGEMVYTDFSDIKNTTSYFSTIIVKE